MEETGLGDRLLLLNASQSFDLKTGRVDPPDEYKYFSSEDRDRYSTEELCDKPYDHERFELSASVSLQRLLGHARARLWTEQEKRQTFPRCAFYFDVSDRSSRYHVPLDSKTIEHVSWDAPLRQPYLRIGAPATLMALLLIGHVSWNIADAALFLDYERVPNVYDPMLYALLNYLRT